MLTSSIFKHHANSTQLDVVLPGGSAGIDSSLIQKIVEDSYKHGNSVIAFNYPYFERGDENSSGPELLEELETVNDYLEMLKPFGFKQIRFVAKSLGGIIASYYLRNVEDQDRYSIVVLGYIPEEVDLKNFKGSIKVIQGDKDKFGDIEAVKADLVGAVSTNISYFAIPHADHSYRDPETKEPVYENEVIQLINS